MIHIELGIKFRIMFSMTQVITCSAAISACEKGRFEADATIFFVLKWRDGAMSHGDSMVIQWWFNGDSMVIQWWFNGDSMVIQWWFNGI